MTASVVSATLYAMTSPAPPSPAATARIPAPRHHHGGGTPAITLRGLTKRFGAVTVLA